MFGLSMKEKLHKFFMRLCEEKLPAFENEKRGVTHRAETMSWQEKEEAYAAALQHCTSAITEKIHRSIPLNAGLRYGAAMLQSAISGQPEEYDGEFDSNPLCAGISLSAATPSRAAELSRAITKRL